MAFTLNRRLSTLVDSSGQLKTGKIPNDYINGDHIADNVITTAMLHTGFTLPISSLTSIDTDDVTEGSTNLFYTTARVDSHLSGGTGVTYSSGAISIGQAVATTDSPTFADLTITGNLNITGDINSYNVTDLDVTDQTITLGAGQIEANSGGSGIIIDGSNASILWDETNDQFDFNKGINVDSNTLVVDGTNNRVGILNAAPDVSLDIGSSTDAIHMPVGTTAQRPSSPAAGYFRYNSDDGQFEGYTTEWGAIAGSGGASAMETNNFTGDGSTTAFTLSSSVSSEDNLIVFIEGIYQNKGDYVASGTTITFDTAPVSGRRIVVQHILSSVAGNSTLYTSLTGDGSTTAFTLSGAPGHENNTQVFMDGVYQQKDSYIVNGTTLTFDAAPANSAEIEVMSFAQTTINQPGTNTVSVAELNLSDGTSGQAIVTDGNGTISFASVGIDGIVSSADATAITIDSSEKVGLNKVPSTWHLDVNSSDVYVASFDGSNDKGVIINSEADSGDIIGYSNSTSTYNPLNIRGATGVGLYIDTSNKVGIRTTAPAVSLDLSSTTDAIRLPNGTRAQRPASPANGMVRYNTTDSEYEVYNSSTWKKLDTTTYSYSADFLVVAGGGGGGNGQNAAVDAGGGGAGGLRTSYGSTSGGGASAESALTLQQAIVYTITVGAGGSAQSNGQNSSISGSNITTITSTGGGAGGGSGELSGQDGGSGGGSAEQGSIQGSGTSGQGYAGGGFGGGGAGEVGSTDGAGYGGDGIQVSITGSATYYAGGGAGGGIGISSGSLPGGDGGGGDGRNEGEDAAGYPGTANTGGGGGGANDDNNASGGTGGSGVVILRVPTASYSGTTTGSPTVTTDGSDTIIKFTSSGTYTG